MGENCGRMSKGQGVDVDEVCVVFKTNEEKIVRRECVYRGAGGAMPDRFLVEVILKV